MSSCGVLSYAVSTCGRVEFCGVELWPSRSFAVFSCVCRVMTV